MWEKRCDEMWNPDWKFCFTDKKYSAHTNICFNKWNWNIFQWDCIFGFCSTSFANGICNGVVAFEQQLCVIVSHNCSILNVKCFFIYYFFSSFDSVRAVHSSIRAAIRLFCWLFSFPAFRKLVIGLRSFLSLPHSLARPPVRPTIHQSQSASRFDRSNVVARLVRFYVHMYVGIYKWFLCESSHTLFRTRKLHRTATKMRWKKAPVHVFVFILK